MADYQFDSILVTDPITLQRAANASVTVYDVSDTSNTTPLPLKDLNGRPLRNPLTSSADAFLPEFTTTSPQVKLVAGTLAVSHASYKALLAEARAAKEFVQGIGVAGTTTAEAGAPAAATIDGKGQFAFTIPKGDTGAKGDKGEPGVWTPEFQAQQQGFWVIASDTPPAATSKYGVPVVWIPTNQHLDPVPLSPLAPGFSNGALTFTIPAQQVGIDYWVRQRTPAGATLVDWAYRAPGTYPIADKPIILDIEARPRKGYIVPSGSIWLFNVADPAKETLLTSSDFGAEAATLDQYVLNAALGGTAGYKFTKGPTDKPESWTVTGGSTVTGGGYQDNSWMRVNLTGIQNIRVEFDYTAGKIKDTWSASSVGVVLCGAEYAVPEISGRYSVSRIGQQMIAKKPDGSETIINLPSTTANDSKFGLRRVIGTQVTPAAVDNLKIFKVGF